MNELINLAELLMNFLATRGPSLNIESQRALATALQQITELIQQSQEPPTTPPQQPELTQAMPSSNIEGFAYDDRNNRLYVRFLGRYPDRMGPVYAYENVPEVIFGLFRNGAVPARTDGRNRWGRWWRGKVPSMGASLYTLLRTQGYDYRRVA